MNLFQTQTDRDNAANQLRGLLTNPGWQTYLQVIEYNIQILTEMILTGIGAAGEDLTEEDMKRLRADLAMWRNFRDTPESMIADFSPSTEIPDSADPY